MQKPHYIQCFNQTGNFLPYIINQMLFNLEKCIQYSWLYGLQFN